MAAAAELVQQMRRRRRAAAALAERGSFDGRARCRIKLYMHQNRATARASLRLYAHGFLWSKVSTTGRKGSPRGGTSPTLEGGRDVLYDRAERLARLIDVSRLRRRRLERAASTVMLEVAVIAAPCVSAPSMPRGGVTDTRSGRSLLL